MAKKAKDSEEKTPKGKEGKTPMIEQVKTDLASLIEKVKKTQDEFRLEGKSLTRLIALEGLLKSSQKSILEL